MNLGNLGKGLRATRLYVQSCHIPIIPELLTASWTNWRESFKERFKQLDSLFRAAA